MKIKNSMKYYLIALGLLGLENNFDLFSISMENLNRNFENFNYCSKNYKKDWILEFVVINWHFIKYFDKIHCKNSGFVYVNYHYSDFFNH